MQKKRLALLGLALIGILGIWGCPDGDQPRDHRIDKTCEDCPIKVE